MPPRKKNVLISMSQNIANLEAGTDIPIEVPKKRERKSKKQSVVAIVTPDGIQGSLIQQDSKRPLIVHLPIHSNDVKFHDQPLMYDPTPPVQPEAYDVSIIDPFSMEATYENVQHSNVQPEKENTKQDESTTQNIRQKKEYTSGTFITVDATTKKEFLLPEKTEIACFWCCDSIEAKPCIIPQSIVDDTWYIYGNFCTPQCALAYLLTEHIDTHVRWERIALLNRLYGSQCNGRVYPAPSRETLQRFGGPLPAGEFRKLCDEQRIRVDIHIPPMVSILASMDTKPIDFYEAPIRTNYNSQLFSAVGPSDEKQDTGLKLKRSKPLKSKDSTLDSCLQIQVKSRGKA